VVKKETRRKLQAKAKCNDPAKFWKSINEIQGKLMKRPSPLTHNGIISSSEKEMAEMFACFLKARLIVCHRA